MNVLFLSVVHRDNIEEQGIYTDLLRQFRDAGHDVYIMSPYERRVNKKTEYRYEKGAHMLSVRIGNITKCGLIEKGVSTIRIERQYLNAIKKYFKNIKFDLIIYPTPPITLVGVVEHIKKRDNAKTYLLLKDIFPQNAVDIGMLKTEGWRNFIYRYFRKKEKRLYEISDNIGCMSTANVNYVLKHNPGILPEIVEVCPNSIDIKRLKALSVDKDDVRAKYNIPKEKTTFIYGGNLGKPQSIPFIIECLELERNNNRIHFVIAGDGTDYVKLKDYIEKQHPENITLLRRLPKHEFDQLTAACDVGLIFLDHRFTIPNFPSRLLSCLQSELPVLACTDVNTDIGQILVEGGFGWWCESDDPKKFSDSISKVINSDLKEMGKIGNQYLKDNYSTERAYKIIMDHYK